MMKLSDVSTAVAFIINGYLRANGADSAEERGDLVDCLRVIRRECDDWAENLTDADERSGA